MRCDGHSRSRAASDRGRRSVAGRLTDVSRRRWGGDIDNCPAPSDSGVGRPELVAERVGRPQVGRRTSRQGGARRIFGRDGRLVETRAVGSAAVSAVAQRRATPTVSGPVRSGLSAVWAFAAGTRIGPIPGAAQ